MTQPNDEPKGCPRHKQTPGGMGGITGGGSNEATGTIAQPNVGRPNITQPDIAQPAEAPPVGTSAGPSGSSGFWRPQSPDVGVSAVEYVLWEMIHDSLQYVN